MDKLQGRISRKRNQKWEKLGTFLSRFGIQLAPWDIPIERRLQTLAAFGWICVMLYSELPCIFLAIYLIRSDYWWAMMIYVFIIAYNRDKIGANHKKSVRNWAWWHYFKDYFPIKLVKTHELDPEKNYLICGFPHGVLCTGIFGNMATDATGFSKIFPGMTPYLLTLGGHFMVPFHRELLSWLGISSASAENINYLLNSKNHKGNCVTLIVGGAEESLYCHNRQYVVVLQKRKGFIKLAMRNESPLVPVITFGETDLYEQANNPKGSLLRKFQDWFKSCTGIAPIMPLGRGLFQYSFGILPQRRPLTTVFGKPLEVARNMDPTDEEIQNVHAQFVKSLVDMFEQHKHKYIEKADDVHLVVK